MFGYGSGMSDLRRGSIWAREVDFDVHGLDMVRRESCEGTALRVIAILEMNRTIVISMRTSFLDAGLLGWSDELIFVFVGLRHYLSLLGWGGSLVAVRGLAYGTFDERGHLVFGAEIGFSDHIFEAQVEDWQIVIARLVGSSSVFDV